MLWLCLLFCWLVDVLCLLLFFFGIEGNFVCGCFERLLIKILLMFFVLFIVCLSGDGDWWGYVCDKLDDVFGIVVKMVFGIRVEVIWF